MDLKEIQPNERFVDEELQQRHEKSSRGAYTRHYVALNGQVEVGLLSVDLIPEYEFFVIYEIRVGPRIRRHGIGSRILHAAEALAAKLGYSKTLLVPKSLSGDFAQNDLEDWYRREGYSLLPNGVGQFAKDL